MPQPGGLTVIYELNPDCGEVGKCADPATGRIWVGEHPGRHTVAHETAHVFWGRFPASWPRMTQLLNLSADTPWYAASEDDYLNRRVLAGELAADAYAACDMGLVPGGRRGKDGVIRGMWFDVYGYNPTARRHARICAFIRTLS
jgi:hypothetical protein